ncbi:glycosyltransferase [Alcanivorax marinus]|uniref:Glycosyltransferase n=1 Tax=Alloalcanivorax marinus TaxID=1177169 RepID=A0A9Q3UP33_9GAMM|nr:glycosyltransferase [Alloalcanivorax marinus]MCC4309521.1 glycosyltransferase [Alloalcanivorax marinus]
MTEVIENSDRPLVTFALFAYNQEKYIREAIEGALSQTYEPLEIILSDDCSKDRTFEIMKEVASAYDGPHRVRVRQGHENVGTLKHVLEVADIARGVYLVVAAGDDVSMPDRTSSLVQSFTSQDIAAVSSDDIVIDEYGNERDWQANRFQLRDRRHIENPTWILGATAAYRSELLKSLPMPAKKILHEDTTFQEVLSICERKSARIKKKLIKRRSHSFNVSFKEPVDNSIEQQEAAVMTRWARKAEIMLYCSGVAFYISKDKQGALRKKYERDSQYFNLLSRWMNLTFLERIELFLLAVTQGRLRACVPRLFGRKLFKFMKSIKLNNL